MSERYARTANFAFVVSVALFFVLAVVNLAYSAVFALGFVLGALCLSSARLAIEWGDKDGDDNAR